MRPRRPDDLEAVLDGLARLSNEILFRCPDRDNIVDVLVALMVCLRQNEKRELDKIVGSASAVLDRLGYTLEALSGNTHLSNRNRQSFAKRLLLELVDNLLEVFFPTKRGAARGSPSPSTKKTLERMMSRGDYAFDVDGALKAGGKIVREALAAAHGEHGLGLKAPIGEADAQQRAAVVAAVIVMAIPLDDHLARLFPWCDEPKDNLQKIARAVLGLHEAGALTALELGQMIVYVYGVAPCSRLHHFFPRKSFGSFHPPKTARPKGLRRGGAKAKGS